MKPILTRFVLLVIVLAGAWFAMKTWQYLADDSNTLPLKQVLSTAQRRDLDCARDGPQLVIVELAHSETEWQLALVNPSAAPAYYHGESPSAQPARLLRGEIKPKYEWRFHDDDRIWRAGSVWTGSAIAKLTLPPYHAGRFSISRRIDGSPVEIRVSYSWGDNHDARGETIWSEPHRQ